MALCLISPAWQISHGTFSLRVGYAEGMHGLTVRHTVCMACRAPRSRFALRTKVFGAAVHFKTEMNPRL
jgi:hypothetical protein